VQATLHLFAKHFIVRIAAAPLSLYAWLKQAERFYSCFAAHCFRILQGRSANAQTHKACAINTMRVTISAMHISFRGTEMA